MKGDQSTETTKPARSAPWNKGKLVGAKPPLRPFHVWSIRTKPLDQRSTMPGIAVDLRQTERDHGRG